MNDVRTKPAPRQLASEDEVAAFLAIPRRTLQAMRLEGRGPRAVRVGKRVRYSWSEVAAWLRANEVRR